MSKEILFVQGPEKTGTSTITGILNCHPEIFILFENYVAQTSITKYGNQLLEYYPGARQFYRYEKDYGKPVRDLFSYLEEKEPEYRYKYVGTKINSLNAEKTQKIKNYKIIFMMRDVKSWLLKESIIKRYRTDLDVVTPSIEFLKYVMNVASYKHSFPLWTEDMVEKNDEVLSELSEYLHTDLVNHAQNWWKQIGKRDKEDPKSVFRLNHVHHSSRIKPEKLDTSYEVIEHPFWNDLDTIFSKYYRKPNLFSISGKQINKDLAAVEELYKYSPLPIEKCYSEAHSVRLGFEKRREYHFMANKNKDGEERSFLNRLKKRLIRIKKAAFESWDIDKSWVIPVTFYDELLLLWYFLL